MAKSMFWKERVAHSFLAVVLTTLIALQANAQSSQLTKITYSCNSTDLETVIEDLSKLTGTYFIYSSNKISTSTPITLSVKDRSLSEVLTLIGKQLNLSFKMEDKHITVKSNGVPFSAPLVEPVSSNKMQISKALDTNKEILAATKPYSSFNSEKINRATDLYSNNGDVSQYLVKLSSYFNPAFLKNTPISDLKSVSKKLNSSPSWFLSVGTVINSYSMGVEVQTGLQRLYMVFNPTWMSNDKFHGAFGLGTSLQFSDAFFLKPIYTYASFKESAASGNSIRTNTPSYEINTAVSHHQIKLMLQYAISKKFSFRAGPSINLSRSITKYDHIETSTFSNAEITRRYPGAAQTGPQHNAYLIRTTQSPADVTTNKLWIGWEAAFSYRIDF